MSDPKAIADELRACVDRGAYSGGGYQYVEVTPEDAVRAADTIDALVKQLADADRQFTALKESSGKADARAVELAAVVEKLGVVAKNCPSITTVDAILSTAPADALAEHDARLIEELADVIARGSERQTRRTVELTLRERARMIRAGAKP